jgi:hypothetical protein
MRWFPLAVFALGAIGAALIVASTPRPKPVRTRQPRVRRLPDHWRALGAL